MSAVQLAPRPVPVLPGSSMNIMRWDVVETDTGRCAFSVIFDARLDAELDIWRRAVALETLINEAGAT